MTVYVTVITRVKDQGNSEPTVGMAERWQRPEKFHTSKFPLAPSTQPGNTTMRDDETPYERWWDSQAGINVPGGKAIGKSWVLGACSTEKLSAFAGKVCLFFCSSRSSERANSLDGPFTAPCSTELCFIRNSRCWRVIIMLLVPFIFYGARRGPAA